MTGNSLYGLPFHDRLLETKQTPYYYGVLEYLQNLSDDELSQLKESTKSVSLRVLPMDLLSRAS